MKRSVVLATTAVAGIAAVAVAFTPASGASVKPGAIRFGVPRVVDPIHTYGEPDIKVAPNGTVYVSGPQGTGVQRSIWNTSYDNGDSWRLVQDNKTGTAYPSSLIPTKSTLGPGGGDTELAVDRHSNVYYADLYALACFTTAYSRDNGRTVSSTPMGCDSPGADRQWLGVYDPAPSDHSISPYKGPKPLIYLKYSDEVGNGSRVDYTDGSNPGNWHTNDKATQIADGTGYGPTDAPIVIDQHTGDLLTPVMHGGGMALAVGQPAKDGSAHLTTKYEPIMPSTLGGDPNTLFPGFAEDKGRNLYVVWVGGNDYQVYYSYAKPLANGRDWGAWSAPIKINRPPSSVQLMPWVAGGKDGIIDVAWYGTDMTLAQLGSDGPSAKKNQSWWAWFAQIDKAASKHPHIVQSVASQHPMKYNDICMLGTGCITATGNRNIADFFEVTIDNQGRARIVYTDTSNGLSSVLGNVEAADHSGAAVVSVATQETGLNAWTGRPLKALETQAPLAQITDAAGDARFPVLGGANVPGADIERIQMARNSKTLRITVTTKNGTLADAAKAAAASYGRLVVRWQMGNTLYHAGVDMNVSGTVTDYYAGKTQSTDSCSVSACDPHTLDYVAPPLQGAVAATGTVKSGQNTIYTIDVPLSAIGNPSAHSLLEEVTGYVFAAPVPGSVQDSKVQSDADEVPLELEGTKSFNFEAAVTKHGTFAGAVLPELLLLPLLGLATIVRRRTARA